MTMPLEQGQHKSWHADRTKSGFPAPLGYDHPSQKHAHYEPSDPAAKKAPSTVLRKHLGNSVEISAAPTEP
jgi:hypothetical protein